MQIVIITLVVAVGVFLAVVILRRFSEPSRRRVQQVVDGVVYDTGDATLIAAHQERAEGDLYLQELYRSNKRSWFVMYRCIVDSWCPADSSGPIRPFTADEAYEWLTRGQHIEALKREFPERLKSG